jgi:hypothetical protein
LVAAVGMHYPCTGNDGLMVHCRSEKRQGSGPAKNCPQLLIGVVLDAGVE